MNVNYATNVLEAWTQTSAKSGFSGASSAASSCSGSSHRATHNGKLHKRDCFPNRQPLRNGGPQGKRRSNQATTNSNDKNERKIYNVTNSGAGVAASDGISLTLKIPNTNDPYQNGQKSSGNFEPSPLGGAETGDCSPYNDTNGLSLGGGHELTGLRGNLDTSYNCTNTARASFNLQLKRGFQGRPPLKPATPQRGHSGSRNPGKTSRVKGTSSVTNTPRFGSPNQDGQYVLEDNDDRGSDNLLTTPPGRKEKTADLQLRLSGAALTAIGKIARRNGTAFSIQRHTPRRDTKTPLAKWESRSSGPSPCHARHCDACAIDDIRHWLTETESGEEKDADQIFFEPLQVIKTFGPEEFSRIRSAPLMTGDRQKMFWVSKPHKTSASSGATQREAATVHTVTVPRKGLIKLTGLPYEFDNPGYYDNGKERSERLSKQKLREELYGNSLPPPPCDLFRGPLIRKKSIIKQVRCGEQRLQAEMAEVEAKQLTEIATYRTFVGGLLEFEMPEVPNLNNNLQKFLGVPSPTLKHSNNSNTNNSSNKHNNRSVSNNAGSSEKSGTVRHRETSRTRSATLAQKLTNQLTPRSVISERQPSESRDISYYVIPKRQAEAFVHSPLHSPRMAFVTTEFLQNKINAVAREKGSSGTIEESPDIDLDARGQNLRQLNKDVEVDETERAEDFDEDEMYHTMTEYGVFHSLGTNDDHFVAKSLDNKIKTKTAQELLLPELAPY